MNLSIDTKRMFVLEDIDDGFKWPPMPYRPFKGVRKVKEAEFPEYAWNVIIKARLKDLSERTIWNESVKFLYFS